MSSSNTEPATTVSPSRPVPVPLALGCIIVALYAPQTWFLLVGRFGDGYWRHWLRFFPGLPVFLPIAPLTHPHDTLTMLSLWLGTTVIVFALFTLSRGKPVLFWILLTCACALSIASALAAHAVFVA